MYRYTLQQCHILWCYISHTIEIKVLQMKVQIAEVRKALGISQGELADRVGMSRPYLAQIENGTRNLTTSRQVALAEGLGVDPSELVDFSAPSQSDEEYMLQSFRRLNPQQRKEWLDLARVATGIGPEQDDKTLRRDPT